MFFHSAAPPLHRARVHSNKEINIENLRELYCLCRAAGRATAGGRVGDYDNESAGRMAIMIKFYDQKLHKRGRARACRNEKKCKNHNSFHAHR